MRRGIGKLHGVKICGVGEVDGGAQQLMYGGKVTPSNNIKWCISETSREGGICEFARTCGVGEWEMYAGDFFFGGRGYPGYKKGCISLLWVLAFIALPFIPWKHRFRGL